MYSNSRFLIQIRLGWLEVYYTDYQSVEKIAYSNNFWVSIDINMSFRLIKLTRLINHGPRISSGIRNLTCWFSRRKKKTAGP